MGKGWLFWALLAVTLAVYAGLVFMAGPPMIELANGGTIPDLQFLGYSPADIKALLAGAEPGFAEAYAQVSQSWDRAVPVLFAMSFGYGIWRGGGVFRLLAVFPVLMGLADLTENTLAVRILLAGLDGFDPGVVAKANAATLAKWGLFVVSLACLIASFFGRSNEGGAP